MSEQSIDDTSAAPAEPSGELPVASGEPGASSGSPSLGNASLASVARSLKLIKVWLIVLTVVLIGVGAATVYSIVDEDEPQESYYGERTEPTDQQVADARAEVEDAYGDDLESVDARVVEVTLGEEMGGRPGGRGTASDHLHRVSPEGGRDAVRCDTDGPDDVGQCFGADPDEGVAGHA